MKIGSPCNMTFLRKSRPLLMLALLTCIYIFNELGHFLLGVLTRSMAQSIEYGDKSCITFKSNARAALNKTMGGLCMVYTAESSCNSAQLHNDDKLVSCEWNYNGRGMDYQILAGPAFMACFTLAGVFWGFTGVTANRVYMLGCATFGVGTALVATAFAGEYWHLVLCRMGLAACSAACTPLSAGLLGEAFPAHKRAVVMGVFNCGIFVGFGASFAFLTYAPVTPFFTESWRTCFFAAGIPPLILSLLLLLTTTEVRGSSCVESNTPDPVNSAENEGNLILELFKLFSRPAVIVLMLAASVRHSAGYTWGYNSALFFQTYHPSLDFGWRLTSVSITGGVIGCVIGGCISDMMAIRYGTYTRTLFLSISILPAAPFAVGILMLDPPFNFLAVFAAFIASETWFGAFYALLLEIAPANQKTTVVAITVLIFNNIGGHLPVFVESLTKATDYRTALLIQYPGALFLSSVLFLLCWIMMRKEVLSTDCCLNEQNITTKRFSFDLALAEPKPVVEFPDRYIVKKLP